MFTKHLPVSRLGEKVVINAGETSAAVNISEPLDIETLICTQEWQNLVAVKCMPIGLLLNQTLLLSMPLRSRYQA